MSSSDSGLEKLMKNVKNPKFWDKRHLKQKFWHSWLGGITRVELFDAHNVLNLSPTGVKISGVRLYGDDDKGKIELFLKAGSNPNKAKSLTDENDEFGEMYQITQRRFWDTRMLPTPEVVIAQMYSDDVPLIVSRYGSNSTHAVDLLAIKDVLGEVNAVLDSDLSDEPSINKTWISKKKKLISTKDKIMLSMLETDNQFHVIGTYWAKEEDLNVRQYENFSEYYSQDKILFYINKFFDWRESSSSLKLNDKIVTLDDLADMDVSKIDSSLDIPDSFKERLSETFDPDEFDVALNMLKITIAKDRVYSLVQDLPDNLSFLNMAGLVGYSTGDGFAHNYQFFYYEDENLGRNLSSSRQKDMSLDYICDLDSSESNSASIGGVIKSATFDPESTVMEHLFINYAKKLIAYDYISGMVEEDSQRCPESTISRINYLFDLALENLLDEYLSFRENRVDEISSRSEFEDVDKTILIKKYDFETEKIGKLLIDEIDLRRDEFYIVGLCEIINTIGRRVNHRINNPSDYITTITSSVGYHPFDESSLSKNYRKNQKKIQFPDAPGAPISLKLDVYKTENALPALFEMKNHINQGYEASTPEYAAIMDTLVEVIDNLEIVFNN